MNDSIKRGVSCVGLVLLLLGTVVLHPAHGHDIESNVHLDDTCVLCVHVVVFDAPQTAAVILATPASRTGEVYEHAGPLVALCHRTNDATRAPPTSLA